MNNQDPGKIHNHKINRIRRNRILFGIVLLMVVVGLFFIFIGRFSFIVASGHLNNVNLAQKTQSKYQQDRRLIAARGTIYDNNHNVIAEDSNVYSIYAIIDKKFISNTGKPMYVQDKHKTAQVLSRYIPLSANTIYGVLNPQSTDVFQVEFGNAGKNISLEVKKEIDAQKLSGIYFTKWPSRLYPNGNFASHVVGLAQPDTSNSDKNGTLVGVMGIENYFNKILTGKNGSRRFKVDSYGYELPNSPAVTKKPVNGDNVSLTLDSRLQTYMENTIANVYDQYAPLNMTAILTDPKTGKILAATQRPTFDPATKAGLDSSWRDTLVQDAFEPGSVMKVLTLSASINSGHYTPNAYYQSGSVNINGNVVKDWNDNGWGSIPFYEAFPRSSNVGFVKIEQQMGAQTWLDYMHRFGIGQKTGIQLPGESAGSISYEHPLDQAITSFGQGVNVTVMQMMQAFSAVANNGTMVKPQIVSSIEDPNTGKVTNQKTQVVGHPITAQTATQVRNAMKDVINQPYGTGQVYSIPGYEIGVKTGTAQIAENGNYLTGANNYIFSVVGMAPIDNPKYILYITMQQPQKMTEDPEKILAAAFNPILKRAMEYDNNSNSAQNVATTQMPNLLGQNIVTAKTQLTNAGLTANVIGSGTKVVQQLPLAKEHVLAGQRVVLLTNGAMTMPDISGWSKNDVLKLAELTGVKIKFMGDGYVTKQSIPVNHLFSSKSNLTVTLAKKSD